MSIPLIQAHLLTSKPELTVSTLITSFFALLGVFFFSYILWKKLKEDYLSDQVFNFTLISLFSWLVGWWAGGNFFPSFQFWTALFMSVVISGLFLKKISMRIFEVIDALVPASLVFLVLLYLGIALQSYSQGVLAWETLVEAEIGLIALFLYKYFQASYRRFSWYPSGKIGFAGLATLVFFFLARGVVGFYFNLWSLLIDHTLKVDAQVLSDIIAMYSLPFLTVVISFALSLTLAIVIYFRSGRLK